MASKISRAIDLVTKDEVMAILCGGCGVYALAYAWIDNSIPFLMSGLLYVYLSLTYINAIEKKSERRKMCNINRNLRDLNQRVNMIEDCLRRPCNIGEDNEQSN